MRTLLWTIVVALVCVAAPARAQELRVVGVGADPVTLTIRDIEGIGLADLKDSREVSVGGATQRSETVYSGVTISRLLDRVGFEKLDRYAVRSATILITARDGYRAAFSWGELFNSPLGAQAILILRENGQPLPARAGAFSVRSFADSRPGPRHVRDTVEIKVILP